MISLNYRDSRPIYEQIKDGLRKLIVTGGCARMKNCRRCGRWRHSWPSIQIPSSGLTTSWRGRGIFTPFPARGALPRAIPGPTRPRKELETQVRELVAELRYLGVTAEELSALVKEAFTR